MNKFESTIAWLFPTILVDGTPWSAMWEEQDKKSFLLASRIFYPVASLVYLLHYFFYDLPNELQPLESWLVFRISMASIALVTLAFYLSPLVRTRWYKIPALVASWTFCQAQAYVVLWHSLDSWIFCYILIAIVVMHLRLSALKSTAFATFTVVTQSFVLVDAGLPVTYIYTGSMVALAFVVIVRSSYLSEIQTFLVNQENIAAQKKMIELSLEFSDRIRSFIPRVIAERMEEYVEHARMTVLEASVEVLAPRKRNVACLFSDIRGFTQGSKNLEEFVGRSVIPEVRVCSDAIEKYRGIPRKIGDLLFAYFDERDIRVNVLGAVLGGMEIARLNHDMNETSSTIRIRRYVLVACGEALVGNLGGLDSSIEITALGTPVNYLSRVDELTKHPKMKRLLGPGDMILCRRSYEMMVDMVPELEFREIQLPGISVRDFPEIDCIYCLKATDSNFSSVLSVHKNSREGKYGIKWKRKLDAA